MFDSCYSLRHIPQSIITNIYTSATKSNSYLYTPYIHMCDTCYNLEELVNIPIINNVSITSNSFADMVNCCSRLMHFTFGAKTRPDLSVSWKAQTIDLSTFVGYVIFADHLLSYNSGLTEDTRITDDASYQLLKDNPDSWTTLVQYSRYNHDSAVETINSLPDTSVYLATAGGTNTIKFKGSAGSATDGGAINTLTDAEIAVAASKG